MLTTSHFLSYPLLVTHSINTPIVSSFSVSPLLLLL